MDNDKLDKTAKAHTDAAAPLMAHTAGKASAAIPSRREMAADATTRRPPHGGGKRKD